MCWGVNLTSYPFLWLRTFVHLLFMKHAQRLFRTRVFSSTAAHNRIAAESHFLSCVRFLATVLSIFLHWYYQENKRAVTFICDGTLTQFRFSLKRHAQKSAILRQLQLTSRPPYSIVVF